jgi:hypothetical protein
MIWHSIHPFIHGGIQLGYNMLFPLLPNETEQDLGFIDGILSK